MDRDDVGQRGQGLVVGGVGTDGHAGEHRRGGVEHLGVRHGRRHVRGHLGGRGLGGRLGGRGCGSRGRLAGAGQDVGEDLRGGGGARLDEEGGRTAGGQARRSAAVEAGGEESWTCCSWSGVSESRSCPARAAMSSGEAEAMPAPPSW
ncbi:hypothetical protein ACFQX8_14215 [Klenkia terrae]|uniref:hypothetical protein n=1 Tax=Klenkia terrae TaxID=1052259 RepID=UPI00361CE5B8